jgi:hypothetical protein
MVLPQRRILSSRGTRDTVTWLLLVEARTIGQRISQLLAPLFFKPATETQAPNMLGELVNVLHTTINLYFFPGETLRIWKRQRKMIRRLRAGYCVARSG